MEEEEQRRERKAKREQVAKRDFTPVCSTCLTIYHSYLYLLLFDLSFSPSHRHVPDACSCGGNHQQRRQMELQAAQRLVCLHVHCSFLHTHTHMLLLLMLMCLYSYTCVYLFIATSCLGLTLCLRAISSPISLKSTFRRPWPRARRWTRPSKVYRYTYTLLFICL